MDELRDDRKGSKREKKVSTNQCQALPNCTLLMKLLKHSFMSTAMEMALFCLKHKVTTKQLSITNLFGK
jgi:hypothetical protein